MPSHSKKQHDFMEAIAHSKAFADKVHIPQRVGRDFVEADKGKHFKKGGINMATMKKRSVNPAMAMMAARAMGNPPAPMAPPAPPMGAPMAGGMKHGGLSKAHHKHLAHHHLAMAEHHMAQHEGHHKMKKMAHGGATHHESEKMHEMNQAKELRRIAKEEEHEAKMMKHGGKAHMKKMAHGGKAESMGPRTMKEDVEKGSNKHDRFGESKVEKRGHTEDRHPKMKGNTIGDGPLVNTKKHGGHVKKMAHGGSTSHRADGIAMRGHTKTKYC